MKVETSIITNALAYCENHALQGAETELEVEMVRWVTEHIMGAIARNHPRFNAGEFKRLANPIASHELRERILSQVNQ